MVGQINILRRNLNGATRQFPSKAVKEAGGIFCICISHPAPWVASYTAIDHFLKPGDIFIT